MLRCPFPGHNDSSPSFSLNVEKGAWTCFGCTPAGGGIYAFEEKYSNCDHATARKNVANLLGHPELEYEKDFSPHSRGTLVAEFEYWDAHRRNLIFRKQKFLLPDGANDYVLQQKVGNSWVNHLRGIEEKVLYGLPDLITADTVFVCEGEKDCDSIRKLELEKVFKGLRFAYVTNFDGAGHWRPEYARFFHAKDCVLCGDNDGPGRAHVRKIARSLTGVASEVRVLEFPGEREGFDVSDWIEEHSDNEGDVGRQFIERVKSAPLFVDDDKDEEWKGLFHSYDECVNAPPIRFGIEGFLQDDGITLIGALPQNLKTFFMLAITRALLEGGQFLHHFPVNRISSRVIYLIPESGLSPFVHRLKLFHLLDYVRDGRLLIRTLNSGKLSLTDPLLREAAKGADMILDTATRFMEGDENASGEQRQFAELLFDLQRAGALTITGAHHSPKGFGGASFMTLENILRGSGDIGAMAATCWGLSQIDSATSRVFVQNVKARDFAPCEPFIIQGRPSIDATGYFELTTPPGFAGSYEENKKNKGGHPPLPEKDELVAQARALKAQGQSQSSIAKALGVDPGTVSRWLKEKVQ